jgi:hypothetical protein
LPFEIHTPTPEVPAVPIAKFPVPGPPMSVILPPWLAMFAVVMPSPNLIPPSGFVAWLRSAMNVTCTPLPVELMLAPPCTMMSRPASRVSCPPPTMAPVRVTATLETVTSALAVFAPATRISVLVKFDAPRVTEPLL